MFRCIKVKRSILPAIPILTSYTQQFHVSSTICLRRVLPKNSFDSVEHENLKNDFDPLICQSSSVDFFGIESDEGVITLKPLQNSLPQSAEEKKLKEKFRRTAFGVIRYDVDNKLKFHGQYQSKIDFLFPRKNNEEAEISEDVQESQNSSLKYSKTLCDNTEVIKNCEPYSPENKERDESYIDKDYFSNISERGSANYNNDDTYSSAEELSFLNKNYFETLSTSENIKSSVNSISEKERNDPYSLEKKEHDENYIDECYFSNISERENADYNNGDIHLPSEELNFIDKSYFKTLTASENSISVKERNEDNNITQSVIQELNFFDEDYLKNLAASGTQQSSNTQEFSNDILLNPEATFDYRKEKNSEVNNIEYFHANLKSDITDDQKPDHFLKSVTPAIESTHILQEYADSNETNATFPSDIKNKSEGFIESNIEINEHSKMSYKDCGQKLKQRKDFENSSSSPDILNANLISKQKGHLTDAIKSNIQNVKSVVKGNDYKHSSYASEEPKEDPSTAHEFVTKLRKEREIPQQNIKKEKTTTDEKFDSKGFRILKNQVDNLAFFTRDEILNLLKQSVVYSDDDLLVLNKPYGLVIHDSQTTKYPCLSMFLNDLAKELDRTATDPKLLTVHRLDKETTGCLLLARNENMAQYLKSLFAERKIIKKYWIVTSRVPDPPEGVIDIPISEGSIDNRKRMVLHPKIPKDIAYRNHSKSGKEAITSYKVISESGNAALVEALSKTGIKHQIRVHFGFGLSCPILGDHKYSHLDKLVPQKLPSDILQRLLVRQSKVRHIPMHIHAKSVTIPDYFDRRNLLVNVPLPNHMKINIKRLKFRKKT